MSTENQNPDDASSAEEKPAAAAESNQVEMAIETQEKSPAKAEEKKDAKKKGKGKGKGKKDDEKQTITRDEDGFVRVAQDEVWVKARGVFEDKDVTGYAPSSESSTLLVDVPVFEGPFDLLLHLIGKHAFNIFDIPIAGITEAYLDTLDQMRALNLDIAGEFLVMASRLAHIKSKMLLPKEEREDEDDEDEEDPRVALVRRLLEYRRFKEVAQELGNYTQLGRDVFYRQEPKPGVTFGAMIDPMGLNLREFEVIKLIDVLDKILKRTKRRIVHEVFVERLNVGARINELVDFAKEREAFTFADVLNKFGGRTRQNMIVTLLSILEMTKLKLLRIQQSDVEAAIYLSPIRENLDGAWDPTQLEITSAVETTPVETPS